MNERGDGGTQAAPRSHAEREWGGGVGLVGDGGGWPRGRPRENKKKFIEPPVTCCVPVT